MPKHPRDRFISVYGRKPVLELLEQTPLPKIHSIRLDKKAKGPTIAAILKKLKQLGLEAERVKGEEVHRISKNPKQDQGIVVDVENSAMDDFSDFFQGPLPSKMAFLALDGVTTPANLGLIIRSATAFGLALLLPRKGSAKLSPLVVKASAGVLFKSQIVGCERLGPALKMAKAVGFKVYALAGGGSSNFYQTQFADRAIFIMGNETEGVGEHLAQYIDEYCHIPMWNAVESLNVACAATTVAAEYARRQL
ncbi:rRNA methylase [Saprospira grandis DSM 2844]|uniref:rRNA methylase n=1 Tax=Saprospira grandis DSM 2844 TaxID=694433 RepID=J1I4R9_9BACT|nr:RNA methyltransferase [Saprospira grandis]EJF53358.1 rRNA methylase [Saprospira grandis DSM 2844]